MAQEKINIAGIVLCGGASRRMGSAKAWLEFDGETLLQRIVRVLSTVVRPLVVAAAVNQELPRLPADVLIVRDSEPGRGPLQGLADGLAALTGRADAVFAASCDMPLLRPEFVARMIELSMDCDICIAQADGRLHPLAAVYQMSVLATARKLLSQNRRQLMLLTDELPTRIVTPAELVDVDPGLLSLRNLNTPEEYKAAMLSGTSQT